jgi:hypothetical protein
MASNHHATPEISKATLERHSQGWHNFTKATVILCVSMAVFLLAMLLMVKVL